MALERFRTRMLSQNYQEFQRTNDQLLERSKAAVRSKNIIYCLQQYQTLLKFISQLEKRERNYQSLRYKYARKRVLVVPVSSAPQCIAKRNCSTIKRGKSLTTDQSRL